MGTMSVLDVRRSSLSRFLLAALGSAQWRTAPSQLPVGSGSGCGKSFSFLGFGRCSFISPTQTFTDLPSGHNMDSRTACASKSVSVLGRRCAAN
ncbi:hypothetical protein DFH06DRAFT_1178778 [Mycena polygramma]|nr:hypothetical protein DFH06DRAFT_1178778 [Mycena polygramma]